MKPREIKAEIIRQGSSLTEIADDIGATISEVSMCVSGTRIYPDIRAKIAQKLGKTVEELFSREDYPQPKRSSCTAA